MQTKVRTERSDKKVRIYPYLKKSTHQKLELLRQSVNINKAVSIHDLAEDLLDVCIEFPEFINWIQDKYSVPGDHPLRIICVKDNGQKKLIRMFEANRPR
ncbi:hypothetical protein EEL32_00055 (plasmid) [Brevibacillus laterosporus]|nr:hypothetical protein [Brevibacillus laterosporus]TPG93488.1 hypothetical protein EEL32_00055 [Brevibacillus laterosporus]